MYPLFSIVLLGLANCAVGLAHNPDPYHNPSIRDTYPRGLANAFSGINDDAHQHGLTDINAGISDDKYPRRDGRQKRAIPSFMQRWKALLKTTLGFRWFKDSTREGKIWFKFGLTSDAVRDFHSLGPTKIEPGDAFATYGYVGDQVMKLVPRLSNSDHPPVLQIIGGKGQNRIERRILYFENMKEAKSYFKAEHYLNL